MSENMEKIIFFGDCNIQRQNSLKVSDNLIDLIQQAKVAFVNLEGAVTSEEFFEPKAGPVLKQGEDILNFLDKIGITHLSLANNHTMDYGLSGLKDTLIKTRKLKCIGAGIKHSDRYEPIFEIVNNKKIGFLAFCEKQFGTTDSTLDNKGGYAIVDSVMAREAVHKTKLQCDHLILQIHAGLEMVHYPLPEWVDIYREFIDLGADLIIGHHPHVVQVSEQYHGKEIYFSIGNFYMDSLFFKEKQEGAVVIVDVVDDKLTSEIKILNIEDESVQLELSSEYLERYQNLMDTYADSEKYMKQIDKISENFWKDYYLRYYQNSLQGVGISFSLRSFISLIRQLMLYFKNRKSKELNRATLLAHNLEINSHRWVVLRALKNIYGFK